MENIKKLEKHEDIVKSQKELEAKQDELMAAEKPMSFASFAPPEIQKRYQRAVDYADMFVELKSKAGVVVAGMAVYYLCRSLHGSKEPCNTIILSKTWNRKFVDDPLHKKQAWYCNICGTKYVSNYGMLIEIFSSGETIYMRAPVKPFDVIDLAGLKFEAELKPETPELLYAAIPSQAMQVTEVVRQADSLDDWKKVGALEGVYKVDNVCYEKLRTWNWFDIFTFSNVNPLTGSKWTKSGKQEHAVGYNDKFGEYVVKSLRLK
jgi:hypothetical protein